MCAVPNHSIHYVKALYKARSRPGTAAENPNSQKELSRVCDFGDFELITSFSLKPLAGELLIFVDFGSSVDKSCSVSTVSWRSNKRAQSSLKVAIWGVNLINPQIKLNHTYLFRRKNGNSGSVHVIFMIFWLPDQGGPHVLARDSSPALLGFPLFFGSSSSLKKSRLQLPFNWLACYSLGKFAGLTPNCLLCLL